MPDRITIEGDERLIQTLLEAAAESKNFAGVNAEVADIVANSAQAQAPVITGQLKDSIVAAYDEGHSVVYTNLDYAPPVHNGWPEHHITAQPFMDEAFADTMGHWLPLYGERVLEILDGVEGA